MGNLSYCRKEVIEQSAAGFLKLVRETLTDNSSVYNVVLHFQEKDVEIACVSLGKATDLFNWLDDDRNVVCIGM